MGSITAFFLLPFLSVFAIFLGIFETLTGVGIEKIVLPYDPQNGIVWEYKEGDEAYIDCIKSEIIDGKQVFTFRGKWEFDKDMPSDGTRELVDDIFFEDENGNIKKYYAFVDFSLSEPTDSVFYGNMDIYEESECAYFQYTVKAETELENCYWHACDGHAYLHQNRYIGQCKLENIHERTYQFVFPPEDVHDQTFNIFFVYRDSKGKQFEKIVVDFQMTNKEVSVIKEVHYVLDENRSFTEVK